MAWGHEISQGLIKAYIFKNRVNRRKRVLIMVAGLLYGEEIILLRRNVCPFCYTKFKKRGDLMTHLERGHGSCSMAWRAMLNNIIRVYHEAAQHAKAVTHRRRLQYYTISGQGGRYRTWAEAIIAYVLTKKRTIRVGA